MDFRFKQTAAIKSLYAFKLSRPPFIIALIVIWVIYSKPLPYLKTLTCFISNKRPISLAVLLVMLNHLPYCSKVVRARLPVPRGMHPGKVCSSLASDAEEATGNICQATTGPTTGCTVHGSWPGDTGWCCGLRRRSPLDG